MYRLYKKNNASVLRWENIEKKYGKGTRNGYKCVKNFYCSM